MSCTGCSIHSKLTPSSGNTGGCSTGGCNRLNVYDWLADVPVPKDTEFDLVEISFKNGSRKGFYRNSNKLELYRGDWVLVETQFGGYDIGMVTLQGELVQLQMKKKNVESTSEEIKSIVRLAKEFDLQKLEEARALDMQTMVKARVIARDMKLNMKIGDVEYQADKRKATFYYTAEDRVDFRELIKKYAGEFHVKIEMRQIGARQEAGKIGGIGSCGRELCCSTWLTDFKSVPTHAARYQNLAINQAKLSGQCGRLKCCLNYELDTYMDALQFIPKHAERLETEAGLANLIKTDIFKAIMWYRLGEHIFPLTAINTQKVMDMNKEGKKPADLVHFAEAAVVEDKIEYVDTVGQISLRSLERNAQKRKQKKAQETRGSQQRQGGQQNRPQTNRPQSGRPQQAKPQQAKPQQAKPQQGGQPPAKPQQQNKPAQAQGKQQQNRPQQKPQQQKPRQQQRPQQQQKPQQPKPPQQDQDKNK